METKEIVEQVRLRNKWYLGIVLVLMALNSLFYPLVLRPYPGYVETLRVILMANFVAFGIIGFLLGTLFAFFPYKGLGYSKKYLRGSLLIILFFQGIETIGLVLLFFFRWMHWLG